MQIFNLSEGKKDHICKNMKSILSSAWRRDEAVNHLNEGIVNIIFFGSNCEYLPIRSIEISSESHNSAKIFSIIFLDQILCSSSRSTSSHLYVVTGTSTHS